MNNKDDELELLISRCSLRDQRALKELYDRVSPFLNGVAFRILHSDSLSNEALQEAFIQIWKNASSYRAEKSKPLTWMCSIVRYRAIDMLEKEHRHKSSLSADIDLDQLVGEEASFDPENQYTATQNQIHIQECLGRLSDKAKVCIELAYLKGYSREEIAQCLNAKVNTVKSWLHRGSERLKECLSSKIQTQT